MIIVFTSTQNSSEFLSAMDIRYDWHSTKRIDVNIIYVDPDTDDRTIVINIAQNFGGRVIAG